VHGITKICRTICEVSRFITVNVPVIQRRQRFTDLSAKLEKAKQDATRPANIPSQQEHEHMMVKFDKMKLSTDKAIIEAEDVLNTKTEELRRLKEELRALQATDTPMEQELDSVA